MRGLLARLALMLATLLVFLALAELILRAVGYEYRPMSIDVENPADARLYHLFRDEHFVSDPELIWRPKRGFGLFNEQGFRGPVVDRPKPPGVTRIFALGDSNTLGWAGPRGPNWPGYLAGLLLRRDARLEVVNAGVWGYSSYQGLRLLERVLAYEPDWVIVSFGSNDAHLVGRSDAEFANRSLFMSTSAGWLVRARLGQLAAAAWDGIRDSGEPRHRVALVAYEGNLREMARLCRAAGVEVLLLTRPYIGPVRREGAWKSFVHLYNLATVRVAEDLELPLVDLYSLYKTRDRFFADESHFTVEGHQLAARLIAAQLEPRLGRAAEGRRGRQAESPRPPA